jgi:hypothetical protein
MTAAVFCLTAGNAAGSAVLSTERPYEPYMVWQRTTEPFYGHPVDELYLFAFDADRSRWRMMPFQIDEMSSVLDPANPDMPPRNTFFAEHNGILDTLDQLVFMIRDMGDRAPDTAWIPDESSKASGRLEIRVMDNSDPSLDAYAYLYHSPSIPDTVPHPYGFQSHPATYELETAVYKIRQETANTLIQDICFKPPFGNGADIFDTQKIRLKGKIVLSIINLQLDATEEYLVAYRYFKRTADPVVRIVHENRLTLLDTTLFQSLAFYNDPKFYPFSGELRGGFKLTEKEIQQRMGVIDDVIVEFHNLRESWDFNENAAGMTFMNPVNDAVPIDGLPDAVNKTVERPIRQWSMATGDQGSLFVFFDMVDTTWKNVELYYHDDRTGGQADSAYFTSEDTGDKKSYGDEGILLMNQPGDTISLQLGFNAYFLPANTAKAAAEKLAAQIKTGLGWSSRLVQWDSAVQNATRRPDHFDLYPNTPNPFNGSTRISFSLKRDAAVRLRLFDVRGRMVATLAEGTWKAGRHELNWDGTGRNGEAVPAGMYFCRLESEGAVRLMKMTLIP